MGSNDTVGDTCCGVYGEHRQGDHCGGGFVKRGGDHGHNNAWHYVDVVWDNEDSGKVGIDKADDKKNEAVIKAAFSRHTA